MLVMRNFGYLGLHAVVDKKSSLARDTLIDFTGELQLRMKAPDELLADDWKATQAPSDGVEEACRLTVPRWHPTFIAEPTVNGGRTGIEEDTTVLRRSAQEMAVVPLQLTPSARLPQPGVQSSIHGSRLHGNDVEPVSHLSFCNELLFHPRLLHNCPSKHIVIKVELREIEWRLDLGTYVAHLPQCGPSIHNTRAVSCSIRFHIVFASRWRSSVFG
jgi:hypothetical protein